MKNNPNIILTDGDPHMANAIKKVFPETAHHLCEWHLIRNIEKHLSHLKKNKDKEYLQIYNNIIGLIKSNDFENSFATIVTNNKISDATKKYLQFLYENKNKWARFYTNNIFTAGLSTTSRSESINAAFKHYLDYNKNTEISSLVKLINKIEDQYMLKSSNRLASAKRNEIDGIDLFKTLSNSIFGYPIKLFPSPIF
jgi:transposase-like protein